MRFRKVYAVCFRNNFYIFEKDLYLDPIEIIEIKKIKTVKSDNDFGNLCFVSYNLKMIIFFKFQKIISEDEVFFLESEDKESWIGVIGKAMVKLGY